MMTYESASEAELLKTLWRPDAPLENTVFAILDPSGGSIVRGGRSPQMVFRDSDDMASRMNEIARYYGSNGATVPKELPAVDTVRLAVDVAACDKRPLVVVVGQSEKERSQLAERLAPSAWSEQLIGKLVYTKGSESDLDSIKNVRRSSGYVFVAPGLFGTDGTALLQLGAGASQKELESASKQALSMFHPQELSHHEHVRAGRQSGIAWQTAIPVTDPHSLQAQQRESGGGASGGGADFSGGTQNGFRPPRPPQGFMPGGPPEGSGGQGIGYGGGRFRSPSASRQTHIREYR